MKTDGKVETVGGKEKRRETEVKGRGKGVWEETRRRVTKRGDRQGGWGDRQGGLADRHGVVGVTQGVVGVTDNG